MALKRPPNPDWPYALILDQIKTRQKAKIKAPSWLEDDNFLFPPSDTLEQASSEATAKYKARLLAGKTFADLTGGAGIDSWALLENFKNGIIIDADETAAQRLAHNFQDKNARIINDTAENFVQTMELVDLALIDPQRRNENRKGLYRFEDCSPNIITLLPALKNKAETILLKTSPMLDINKAVQELKYVSEVHILEWQGECKEVLYVLKQDQNETDNIQITATKIDSAGNPSQSLTFSRKKEQNATARISQPQTYLYEPGPAFIKSGAYKTLCIHYDVAKLAPHTHLYTSEIFCKNFPGRSFEIINIYPTKTKALPFTKANLTIRNFPQNTITLKKKLKLKDGGDEYLFACTIEDEKGKEKHILIHCRKPSLRIDKI